MRHLLIKTLFASALSLGVSASFATTITFNDTAPAAGYTNYDFAGTYTDVSGFTLKGRFGDDANPSDFYSSTIVYTVSPTYDSSLLPSANGTDFAYLSKGGAVVVPAPTATLSNGHTPFSLQSFLGANLASYPAGALTLTGHQIGGGTLIQTFNTLGTNQWSLFTLTGWSNLTSVDFVGSENGIGLDSLVVNETSTVPEPNIALLLLSGLFGLGLVKNQHTKYSKVR